MTGQVRIIGGRFRGRKVPVLDKPGLRPTTDFVRETAFNWLTPFLRGQRCLDLFGGTGVFSLEALSRGAAVVDLIEKDPQVIAELKTQKERFKLEEAEWNLYQGDALTQLPQLDQQYHVIFCDPPFGKGLAKAALDKIIECDCLTPGGLVYLEAGLAEDIPLDSNWLVHRSKVTGQVRYHVLKRGDV